MKKLNEVFSEETIYVVHSDTNENNILQDFEDLSAALEYAKDNIDELTYVEEVIKNAESDEIYSTEIIWSYDEDDAEDQIVCEWCHDLVYETECRKELNLGLICRNCQSALYSRGEKPVFEEAYDSDYAEGDDIFDQEFPEASFESKYNLENSSKPKKLMKEGLNSSEFTEYMQLCKEIGIKGNKDLESFMKEVGLEAGCDPYKLLDALRKYRAELGPDFKIVNESSKKELNELFGSSKKKQSKNRYVLAMFRDKSGRLLTSDLWKDICNIVDSYAKSHEKSHKKYFSAPTLFQIEFVTTEQAANNLKRKINALLDDLRYQRKYISGTHDHINSADEINADVAKSAQYLIKMECIEKNITEALSEDPHISESLKESLDLPMMRASEIKRELELHGDISFDLIEPIEESDEDGWRSASEFIIIEIDNGSYEGYYLWLDQDGDMIESGADEYYDNFEELLYAIDGVYVNIVDLDAYIGSQLAEELKEAKKSLNESQAQEISNEYRKLSKEYGIDFEDLVYGEKGFMKTKYPEGFPDFAGDVIYSEKYWNELVEFAKEQNIDLK